MDPLKHLARLVAVVGAVAVAWILFGGGPKDVVLVYEVPADATALRVEIRRGREIVRRAEFRLAPGASGPVQVRHEAQLPQGTHEVAWGLDEPGGERRGARSVSIHEDGTIALSLLR